MKAILRAALLLTVITGIGLLLSPSLYADTLTLNLITNQAVYPSISFPTVDLDLTLHLKPEYGTYWYSGGLFYVTGTEDVITRMTGTVNSYPVTLESGWIWSTLGSTNILGNLLFSADGIDYRIINDTNGLLLDTTTYELPLTGDPADDPVQTVPEPSTLTLAFIGLLASVGILIYRQGLRNHDRR